MKYCGRQFEQAEIEVIRAMIAADQHLSRYRLSAMVCEQLNWRRPDGGLKDMSCRVAMLRMQTDGLFSLPPARRAKPATHVENSEIEAAVDRPLIVPEVNLDRLTVDLVVEKRDSLLWNAYVRRHHYLGHQLIPGAQLRYFIRAEGEPVALLSFGASAWKIRPRDEYIGWSPEQRQRNLHLVVNNSRFLIQSSYRGMRLGSALGRPFIVDFGASFLATTPCGRRAGPRRAAATASVLSASRSRRHRWAALTSVALGSGRSWPDRS